MTTSTDIDWALDADHKMTLPFSQDSNEFMLTELLPHNSTMEDGIYRYRISSPLSAGHLQSLKLQLRYPRAIPYYCSTEVRVWPT